MGLICARSDQLLLRVILECAQRGMCPTVGLSTVEDVLTHTTGFGFSMNEAIRGCEELQLIEIDGAAGMVTITTTGCLMAGPYDLPKDITEAMGPSSRE